MLRLFDGGQRWYRPLPQLLSNVGVGLVVEHPGKVVLVNDRFCRFSGFARAELLALQTFSRAFAAYGRQFLARGSAPRASAGDQPHTLQALIVRRDGGDVLVATSVHLGASDGGPEIVATFRGLERA